MYSPSHHQAENASISIQSTFRNAANLCKNVSLTILFSCNGSSYIFSTQSDMCVCTHMFHSVETPVGHKKHKSGTTVDSTCQGYLSACHTFVSPGLYLPTYSMEQSPWEANRFSTSQEIPHTLRNPKVHYRIHKRPPPVHIQSISPGSRLFS